MAKKAQSFFIAGDENKDSNEELTIDQKIKQFSINNRPQFMALPNVVGVHTAKGRNVTAIILRMAKDFNGWKERPKWLKVAENSPKSSEKLIKGFYNIVNNGKILKVDNENIVVILQSEEADINVESLKKAINDIGPTKKYSYYNYTKAQNYFLEFVETGNNNNDDNINKQVKKFGNQLRKKVMGLDNVHGINVEQFDNIDYLTIVARVGKGYQTWKKYPIFLRKPEKEIEFKDDTVLDHFIIIDEDSNKPVKIDNKCVLLVIKHENIKIDALKPAKNDIGGTKKHDYKNYTKAQSYVIGFDDDNSEKKLDSTDSKIKKVSIDNRLHLRNINGVIGVKTQKCKGIDKAVIVLRVSKDFKNFEKMPKILSKAQNPHKTNMNNVRGWYYLLNQDGKKITVDNEPVLVCTFAETFKQEIDSLKSPENKINPSKKAPYPKN